MTEERKRFLVFCFQWFTCDRDSHTRLATAAWGSAGGGAGAQPSDRHLGFFVLVSKTSLKPHMAPGHRNLSPGLKVMKAQLLKH